MLAYAFFWVFSFSFYFFGVNKEGIENEGLMVQVLKILDLEKTQVSCTSNGFLRVKLCS